MYRKRLKTLKIRLKNAFGELAGCGRSPNRKPNDYSALSNAFFTYFAVLATLQKLRGYGDFKKLSNADKYAIPHPQ